MQSDFKLSASKLRTFKACRRKYELSYIEKLRPIQKEEALEMGSNYHSNIERILKGETISEEILTQEDAKIYAMSKAFEKYILPQLPPVFAVEQKFEFKLPNGSIINGIVDAMTETGMVIEHKSSGTPLDEKYINRLDWDDQVPIYMLATATNKCFYTVCQKPTIRQKQNESLEEFAERCIKWYEDDTERKAGTFTVVRTPEDLLEKRQELEEMAEEIKNAKLFYRNPNHCSIMGCPYSSICLNYDPDIEPIGFERGE